MKRKIFKYIGIGLLSVLALLLSGYLLIKRSVDTRITQKYAFPAERLELATDSATLARGRHLVAIKGCQDCHGADLSGKVLNDDGALGRLVATNITTGKGGLAPNYTTDDWVRALRHGVDKSGRPLLLMPSQETTLLSVEDLSAVIAYCQQVPAVDNTLPTNSLGPLGVLLTHFDKIPLLSVEKIDHTQPMLARADTTEGVAQGKYLAVSCSGCHRTDFKGGEPVVPGQPPVPDLTSAGHIGKWTQEQFIQTLRTGKTPDGHQMKNEDMPWKMTAQYEQKELASLYQYFRSLP